MHAGLPMGDRPQRGWLGRHQSNVLFFFGGAFFTLLMILGFAWHSPKLPDLFRNVVATDSAATPPTPTSNGGGSPTHKNPRPNYTDRPFNGTYGDISDLLTEEEHSYAVANAAMPHWEVRSNMSTDGKLYRLDFLDQGSYNPNIIPHPKKADTWIMVAQRDKEHDMTMYYNAELVCEAQFINGKMTCLQSPLTLPIASTMSPKCHGDMEYFKNLVGPHDARVFMGPNGPYIIYGSQSPYNCLGQFIHDFRRVADFDWGDPLNDVDEWFFYPTVLQRTEPYFKIEKNFFVFWDTAGNVYVHFDLEPTRGFAKLNKDGSIGEDLGVHSSFNDKECMAELMPHLRPTLEWLHQATNSLAITMCNRSDPECKPTDDNTFIFIIFQTKTYYMHGNYDPYVMVFKQTAPFEVYGISKNPFWIHGRGRAGTYWTDQAWKPKDQHELLFTMSMNWKTQGQNYHGYLDDVLFLTFGIEDQESGAIDVVAGEFMKNLTLCSDILSSKNGSGTATLPAN